MYKVLIIDDEAPARIAISRLGHWADYHITELYQETNGAAALKTMREIKPQIVFVDMQMPVMNGYEATKKIRSLDREDAKVVPIIAMTANAFTEDRIRAKEAGMDEHIAKPIDVKLLVNIIYKLMKHSFRGSHNEKEKTE